MTKREKLLEQLAKDLQARIEENERWFQAFRQEVAEKHRTLGIKDPAGPEEGEGHE